MDDEELEAKEESLASDWANYYPSAFFPFLPQWPADPGNRDRAPSPHSPGPWPPFLSDEVWTEGSADVGRGGESGGRGGESNAEIAEEEVLGCRAARTGSPAWVSEHLAYHWARGQRNVSALGHRIAQPFGAGRQGPCDRQAGSPSSYRDP